jgi:hypothetical protein
VIISQTIFQNRQPIGRIFSDTSSGLFSFVPTKGASRLPDQRWADVDELKKAIHDAYVKVKP